MDGLSLIISQKKAKFCVKKKRDRTKKREIIEEKERKREMKERNKEGDGNQYIYIYIIYIYIYIYGRFGKRDREKEREKRSDKEKRRRKRKICIPRLYVSIIYQLICLWASSSLFLFFTVFHFQFSLSIFISFSMPALIFCQLYSYQLRIIFITHMKYKQSPYT